MQFTSPANDLSFRTLFFPLAWYTYIGSFYTYPSKHFCFQKSVFFHILGYLFPTTTTHLSTVGSLCRPLVCMINGSGVKLCKCRYWEVPSEERGCRMVVELIDPVTGSQQMSLDEWPFCGEFTIVRVLTTASTNNYFLRIRIIKSSLVEHIKPSSYHRNEGAVVWFLSICSPKFNSCPFLYFFSSHPHMCPLWGSDGANNRWLFPHPHSRILRCIFHLQDLQSYSSSAL